MQKSVNTSKQREQVWNQNYLQNCQIIWRCFYTLGYKPLKIICHAQYSALSLSHNIAYFQTNRFTSETYSITINEVESQKAWQEKYCNPNEVSYAAKARGQVFLISGQLLGFRILLICRGQQHLFHNESIIVKCIASTVRVI